MALDGCLTTVAGQPLSQRARQRFWRWTLPRKAHLLEQEFEALALRCPCSKDIDVLAAAVNDLRRDALAPQRLLQLRQDGFRFRALGAERVAELVRSLLAGRLRQNTRLLSVQA